MRPIWYWRSNKPMVKWCVEKKTWNNLQVEFVVGIRSDGTKQQHYYNEISTSIAIGILLCALQSVGLNSLVNILSSYTLSIRLLLCIHIINIHVCFFSFFLMLFSLLGTCVIFVLCQQIALGFFESFFSHSGVLCLCVNAFVGNHSTELRTGPSSATWSANKWETVSSHAGWICSRWLSRSWSAEKITWRYLGDILMLQYWSDKLMLRERRMNIDCV